MQEKKPKVAIVHDWLVGYAGGDRVVDCMHHVFPNAVIYTLVYDPACGSGSLDIVNVPETMGWVDDVP